LTSSTIFHHNPCSLCITNCRPKQKMRQQLGPMLFAQEFEGEFIDAESSAFSSDMIALALVSDFERFIA